MGPIKSWDNENKNDNRAHTKAFNQIKRIQSCGEEWRNFTRIIKKNVDQN